MSFLQSFVQSSEFANLKLKNALDMHLHLREGELLKAVLPFSARHFALALVMPNLSKPIFDTAAALAYKQQILAHCADFGVRDFVPFMSLYLSENLDFSELEKARAAGVRILKLYPKGATTNSENGVSEVLSDKMLELLAHAQELDFILSIHGESGGFCLEREFEFLRIYEFLAKTFGKLKIIIEHMSDRRSLELLEKYENLFGTLTLHHITLSLDDVMGGNLRPDLFCKPMIKTPLDRDALCNAALNAHPKISFGSDSAPHLASKKYSPSAPGGIFSAPCALQCLASLFAFHNKLENLQKFVSDNGVKNYGLDSELSGISKAVELKNEPCKIPESVSLDCEKIAVLFGAQSASFGI